MKLPPARHKAYAASPDRACVATLLFGPNGSLAETYAKRIITALGGQSEEISGEFIKQNPAVLMEKLCNLGLFDDPQAYFISGAVDGITKDIEAALTKIPNGSHLVVLAGDLSAKSSLRALFEKGANIAALACYDDEPYALKADLKSMLAVSGKRAGDDALDTLLEKISYKRYCLNSEVQKIITYLGDETTFDETLVEELVSGIDSADFSDFSNAALAMDRGALYRALKASEAEGSVPITIIRGYLWYLFRLYATRVRMDGGEPFDTAIQSLYPKVFYKALTMFRKHVSDNTSAKLLERIAELLDLERDFKFQKLPGSIESVYGVISL